MSDTDIRPCLTGGEKRRSESSLVVAEVARVIHGGGRGSEPMIPKPRAKGAQGSEDHLCKRNCLMAGPIGGKAGASGGGSHLSIGGATTWGRKLWPAFSFLYVEEREREWFQSCTSATVGRQLTGPTKPRRDVGSPAPCH
jgi:hypothetical protein